MAELTPQDPIRRRELPTEAPQAPPPIEDKALAAWLSRLAQSFTAHAREIRKKLDDALYGKVNWVGDFTLTDGGATTTVVSDDRVTSDCEISLMPLTANAASLLVKVYVRLADLGPGVRWAANQVGQFTVNHPAVVDADFTYRYSIKG